MKDRSPDQTVVSISLSRGLLADIDARAASLNMARSRYLASLARKDVLQGGALTIDPDHAPPPDIPDEAVEDFLQMAVPALTQYDAQSHGVQLKIEVPEGPQSDSEKAFWDYFLREREQILKLKWIESQKAG
ncbi:MAG: hypothetical protein ACO3ZW_09600, partial [Opitutales bacterium]